MNMFGGTMSLVGLGFVIIVAVVLYYGWKGDKDQWGGGFK